VNLENTIHYAQNMGPVFWIAALAVALGATLLIVSLLAQIRNIGLRSPSFKNFLKVQRRPASSGNSSAKGQKSFNQTIRKTETGYQPGGSSAMASNGNTVPETNQDTADLTNRLRKAADTLEEIKQCLQRDNFKPGYSGLKDEAEGVEYLFKTTVG
jgi:hypothetical protein